MVRPDGERVGITGDELADHVCEQGNPGNREGWSHAEVGLPRPLLAGGLEIVDTPGVGGLSSVHGAATTAALPSADAVLLVSDAAQEYTAPELEFLAHAASVCPNVACVITKTDLHPSGGASSSSTAATSPPRGSRAEIFAVSSTLRWHAVLHGDAELNAESGFPELVALPAPSGCSGRPTGWPAAACARRPRRHRADRAATCAPSARRSRTRPPSRALTRELTEAQAHATALKERFGPLAADPQRRRSPTSTPTSTTTCATG